MLNKSRKGGTMRLTKQEKKDLEYLLEVAECNSYSELRFIEEHEEDYEEISFLDLKIEETQRLKSIKSIQKKL
jgi:hypothetical protein